MPTRNRDLAIPPQFYSLLDEFHITKDRELAAEMLQSVVKLAADEPGRGEMKLMLRSYKELRYAFKIFKRYRHRRKVSVFGSARTPTDHPNYLSAAAFGKLLADKGFMVITGAGGGIMAAGHEGAGQEASFGVAIKLPFEQKTNPFIHGDEKLIHFRYFFSRKLVFVKETHAIALYPGGFGTHDEGFEVLTLVQTGRCDPLPIVLMEAPGGSYWTDWDHFIRKQLLGNHLISPQDPSLYYITNDPAAATQHICRFYRNYHSCRWVKDELFLRIKHAPTPAELDDLNTRFGAICAKGTIESRKTQFVDEETLVPELPRIVLKFNRHELAKLRQLIDALNALPSLPPESYDKSIAETGDKRSDRGLGEMVEEESVRLVEPR